jgi:hypothetical protein
MLTKERRSKEYFTWLSELPHFENGYAATLTMKTWCDGERLNEFNSSKPLKNLIGRITRILFGNNYKRRGKSLKAIAAIESSKNGRLHYHCLLDLVGITNADEARQLIENCWRKVRFSDHQIDVKPIHDQDGWIKYITKLNNETDDLDIINTNFD